MKNYLFLLLFLFCINAYAEFNLQMQQNSD